MSLDLGLVAIQLVFVVPGMALLFALGFVDRPRQLPLALGPAYLLGVAALLPVLILLLVLGLPVRLAAVLVAATVLTAASVGVAIALDRRGRRPRPAEEPPEAGRVERWIGGVGLALLGLFFVFGAGAFTNRPTIGDDWQMWSYKALGLFHYGDLQPEIFAGVAPGPTHYDYPILKPLFDSILYRGAGEGDVQLAHLFLWILFGSFVWTVAYLMLRRGFALVVTLPVVATVALTVGSQDVTQTGYVDVMVAGFIAAGVLCIGVWLADRAGFAWAALGSIWLVAAANTKNEGLVAAAIVLVVAGAHLRLTRDGRARQWLAALAIAAAGALPWVMWRAAHHLGNTDVRTGDAIDPGFLAGRLDRLSPAVGQTLRNLADQARWSWIVPCFVALAVICIVRGECRRLSAFYLGCAALMLASLWWVYWAGTLPVLDWLFYSANRTIAGVVFVCGVGLAHVAAMLFRSRTS